MRCGLRDSHSQDYRNGCAAMSPDHQGGSWKSSDAGPRAITLPISSAGENDLRGSILLHGWIVAPGTFISHDIGFRRHPAHVGLSLTTWSVRVNGRQDVTETAVHFFGGCVCPVHPCRVFVYARGHQRRAGVHVPGHPARALGSEHECDHEHCSVGAHIASRSIGLSRTVQGHGLSAHCCCSEDEPERARLAESPTPRTTRRSRVRTTPATAQRTRGRCFWVRGRLSTNDMISAIRRDFPRLWAHHGPFGMATHGSDVDPAPASHRRDRCRAREHVGDVHRQIFPGTLESLVGTTIDLTRRRRRHHPSPDAPENGVDLSP